MLGKSFQIGGHYPPAYQGGEAVLAFDKPNLSRDLKHRKKAQAPASARKHTTLPTAKTRDGHRVYIPTFNT